MRRALAPVLVLLFLSVNMFSFSHNLIKVLNLLKKISAKMTDYSGLLDDHYKQFIEFYQERWAQYHAKFSERESDVLDDRGAETVYQGAEVDTDKMDVKWKIIFKDPGRLREQFPNLYNTAHYKNDPRYLTDPEFKKHTDKNISDAHEYLKRIELLVTLLRNTRESQMIRGKKVPELNRYIQNFSKPKGHDEVRMGRLTGLEVIIDHEIGKQFVELVSLLNAQTEIAIRSALMSENMSNRNRLFRYQDPVRGKGLEK